MDDERITAQDAETLLMLLSRTNMGSVVSTDTAVELIVKLDKIRKNVRPVSGPTDNNPKEESHGVE